MTIMDPLPDLWEVPDDTPAAVFFRTLYREQTGTVELRTFAPDDADHSLHAEVARLRDFVPMTLGRLDLRRVERFLQGCAKAGLGAFFGVSLRTPAAVTDGKGGADYCQTLPALILDIDFRKLGEAETRRRLMAMPFAPSIIVRSGNGLHVYFLLRTPIDLRTTAYSYARDLLQRLAWSVCEIVDTSVSAPHSVLRIPGGLNFKYDPPSPVVVELIADTYIDVAAVAQLPAPPPTTSGSSGSGEPFVLPETIVERHPTLHKLMRALVAHGVPLEGALQTCAAVNRDRCRPPLDDLNELDGFLRRAYRQKDRGNFVRSPKTGWDLAGSLVEIGLPIDAVLVAVRSVTPDFDPEKIDESPIHVADIPAALHGLSDLRGL